MNAILHAMGKVKPEPADIGNKTVFICKDDQCAVMRQGKRSEKVIRQLILAELSHSEASIAVLSDVIRSNKDTIKRHLDALVVQGAIMKKEGRSAYNRKEFKYYLAMNGEVLRAIA